MIHFFLPMQVNLNVKSNTRCWRSERQKVWERKLHALENNAAMVLF